MRARNPPPPSFAGGGQDGGLLRLGIGEEGGAAADLFLDLRDGAGGGAELGMCGLARDAAAGALVGAELEVAHAGQALGEFGRLADCARGGVVVGWLGVRRHALTLRRAWRSAQGWRLCVLEDG